MEPSVGSFFEGWDASKKKDKTKGRQDHVSTYDRHRVKLHPLLGDPNSDYINANYIDVSGDRACLWGSGPQQELPGGCQGLSSSISRSLDSPGWAGLCIPETHHEGPA
ncbi:receptor-type tyrosine-protein phosphatase U-like [Neopelma chrysocephalum]|uniref:receptor-type tyrosine-protein phosphatase U-like n=1 Tax=Neopelma chrysocephalum TaxID=114329 RepID=UPI000FCD04D0|nr:receptor-type tyrosine-protein phosphatase U-like [Neopelma chrysocephalum]